MTDEGLVQVIAPSFTGLAPGLPKSIHELVSDVMEDVRAVRKESTNRQGGYNFRGIDAVVNAVGPILRRHRVTVMPHKVKSVEYATVVVGQNKTTMSSVRVVMVYRWRGPAGDHLDTQVPGEAFDSGDKATAKAMSVAYRTLFLQGLTLPTDEPDPDSHTYQQTGQVTPEMERDLGRWRGEVSAAGTNRVKLGDLWQRMRAEWENVPWSQDRLEILQPAIDRAREAAQNPAPAAAPVRSGAAEGEDTGEAELIAQQAREWDDAWRRQLKAATDGRDVPAVRALIKKAMEARAKHLADEGRTVLDGWRTQK
jgi:hypothetical protein